MKRPISNLTENILVIQEVLKGIDTVLSTTVNTEKIPAHFKISDGRLTLISEDFPRLNTPDRWIYEDLTLESSKQVFQIDKFHINGRKMSSTKSFFSIKGSTRAIQTCSFSKELAKYHRAIFPCDKIPELMFCIQTIKKTYLFDERQATTMSAIEVLIDQSHLQLFFASNKENENYCIIEANKEQSFETFSEQSFNIRCALGFITGNFIADVGYYFQYSDIAMTKHSGYCVRSLRKSIRTLAKPIYTNAYGYIDDKSIAQEYFGTLSPISEVSFSKLCQNILDSNLLRTCVLLFIETRTQSTLSRAATLTLILENLGSYFKKTLPSPQQNIQEVTGLLKQIETLYDNQEKNIPENLRSLLRSRIKNLAQPSNFDKFIQPYEILNIELNDLDKQILKQRNTIFHGSIPKLTSIANVSNDLILHFMFQKLYVLVSALILKYVGFEGKVVNHPKISEKSNNIPLPNEEHYRQI